MLCYSTWSDMLHSHSCHRSSSTPLPHLATMTSPLFSRLSVSSSSSSCSSSHSSTSSPTSLTSTTSLPMSSITPPSSPPSPTMSMGSIHGGRPALLDCQLQEQPPRRLRVMIVDDNSINLAILSRMLERNFADTVHLTAVMSSGPAALERLCIDIVDLILMDIDMPVLTGIQTTEAIRNSASTEYLILEQNRKVPIIAVTTSDSPAEQEIYRQVGMTDCVSKPIALPKLRLAIEQAVGLSSTSELATG